MAIIPYTSPKIYSPEIYTAVNPRASKHTDCGGGPSQAIWKSSCRTTSRRRDSPITGRSIPWNRIRKRTPVLTCARAVYIRGIPPHARTVRVSTISISPRYLERARERERGDRARIYIRVRAWVYIRVRCAAQVQRFLSLRGRALCFCATARLFRAIHFFFSFWNGKA